MRVLIIGDGGREYSLAKNISRHNLRKNTYVITNKKIFSKVSKIVPYFNENDLDYIVKVAKELKIDLTIVGPENWLEKGIVDKFNQNNLKIFGPSQQASLVETSKEFAKKILNKANINTAKYATFNDLHSSIKYLDKVNYPIVIKDDKLAQGKGVSIAQNKSQALHFITQLCSLKHTFIIEEFLTGKEFSHFSLVWNNKFITLGIAKDHKRLKDLDLGPNTGGMGVLTPVEYVNEKDLKYVDEQIISPFLNQLSEQGIVYNGFLYTGLIKDANDKISVIEFNVRMGDPECEILMELYQSNIAKDILDFINQKDIEIKLSNESIIGVVLAHYKYPSKDIYNIEVPNLESLNYIPMGMDRDVDTNVGTGGRIALVYEKAPTLEIARQTLYDKLNKIEFSTIYYRNDIGAQTNDK